MPRLTREQKEQERQRLAELARREQEEFRKNLPRRLLDLMSLAYDANVGVQARGHADTDLRVSFYKSNYDPVTDRDEELIDEVLGLDSEPYRVDSVEYRLKMIIADREESRRMEQLAREVWEKKLTEDERSSIRLYHRSLF